jgi:anthranilate 1,2-dioxygenase small subunit
MIDTISDDRLYRLIGAAQAAYVRCIDDDGAAGWPDFFKEECLYVVTTADNHRRGLEAGLIYADSRTMLVDRIAALNDANIYEQHGYRHILGQPWIRERTGGEARVETGFMVARIMRTGETSLFATGRYLDLYHIDGDQPLLRERIVVCDSKSIDTLLALPL